MEKGQALEFLETIKGETVYVINESKKYDYDEYDVILTLPGIFTDELYELMVQSIGEDKVELSRWRQCFLPEDDVFILYIKSVKGNKDE